MTDLSRQGFLGDDQERVLAAIKIGVVGLGGGGSQFAQQLAHIGFKNALFLDPDSIEESNLNRLVGGTRWDVFRHRAKVAIASRTIRRIRRGISIQAKQKKWQDALEELKSCDIVLGAVDGYLQRAELEAFCRRFLIPDIDVGMDVKALDDGSYLISGQVITSLPGGPCMRCCNFVTDARLEEEARKYGDVGVNPQVIWPNGVLASAAIGELMKLVLPWFAHNSEFNYLVYDGNKNELRRSAFVDALRDATCPHHPWAQVGDPMFDAAKLTIPPPRLIEWIRRWFRPIR